MMERLIKRIADITAEKLGYDDEKADVIAYGLLALTQMLTLFILSSLIGIIFGCFIECFILFLFAGILRKFTGGVHSKTLFGCMIIAIFIIGVLGAFSKYAFLSIFDTLLINTNLYYLVYIAAAIIFIPCILLVYKVAPVDSPNKPIRKPEKRKRLKRQSVITIFVYFAFVILLLALALSQRNAAYFTAALALGVSTIWQCFTLTRLGNRFISTIDFIKPAGN